MIKMLMFFISGFKKNHFGKWYWSQGRWYMYDNKSMWLTCVLSSQFCGKSKKSALKTEVMFLRKQRVEFPVTQ